MAGRPDLGVGRDVIFDGFLDVTLAGWGSGPGDLVFGLGGGFGG